MVVRAKELDLCEQELMWTCVGSTQQRQHSSTSHLCHGGCRNSKQFFLIFKILKKSQIP